MKNVVKTLFAIVAIAITMGALWYSNRVVPPKRSHLGG
jgi:hypothetical protein